jgi:hypothetical protein
MVDVTDPDTRKLDKEAGVLGAALVTLFIGAGPTTRVDPSVVRVSTPVIEDPDGSASVIVDPSDSVSVSRSDPEVVDVDKGASVSVDPSVVIV